MNLEIDLSRQKMWLLDGDARVEEFTVSTGANGPGEINGSGCTPRGWHVIRAKVGAGLAEGAVLRGRRPTGEIWTPELHTAFPGRDWILTRILWLSGTEPGQNRLGCVDTFRRYVYLHGTPPITRMGAPGSKGCVRVGNQDIIRLFDAVDVGTRVWLHE
tara:strand:+ start:18199 stop:18675 length:477 start_codon:yes stop_codon:yes gene_type:complete